jgi:predicted GIY-YIG superfamily endonuclease
MSYWVHVLANKPGGTLYVGMTNDLIRRVYEHREGWAQGFTKRSSVKTLVYFEPMAQSLQHSSAKKISSIGLMNGKSI